MECREKMSGGRTKCPGCNVLNPSCTWTDGQAKMLIMSTLKSKETLQTFHVLYFPFWEGYEDFCSIPQPMGWMPLNSWMVQYISEFETSLMHRWN